MSINKQALDMFGVTEIEYKTWCRKRKMNMNALKTKQQFFRWLSEGRIERDKNGFLIKKSIPKNGSQN